MHLKYYQHKFQNVPIIIIISFYLVGITHCLGSL